MRLRTATAVLMAGMMTLGGVAGAQPAPAAIERPQGEPAAAARGEALTEDEERDLAAKSEEPDETVTGGALNTQQLTYIVIALAAAVLVLIFK